MQNPEAALVGREEYPLERHQRHAVLRIAAADIRMYARKPNLLDSWISLPENRLKGGTSFIDCKSLTGVVHLPAQLMVWKLEAMEKGIENITAMQGSAHRVH